MKMFPFKRQIAVVGLHNSGKTVLLTSLLDQMKNFSRDTFKITRNGTPTEARICDFALLSSETPSKLSSTVSETLGKVPFLGAVFADDVKLHVEEFPYKRFRTALVENGKWPEKTAQAYTARCQFRFTDSSRVYDLTFLDVPGERFSDSAMYNTSYQSWSDALLEEIHTSEESRVYLDAYTAALSDMSEMHEVILAYKKLLGHLLHDYRPLVSPSFFLLDEQGTQPTGANTEDDILRLAHERCVGLTAEQQFAPLPATIRERRPAWAEEYARHYSAYRDEVVHPLFTRLRRSHRLVIVVDIPDMLCHSTSRFNDCHTLLEFLTARIRPPKTRINDALDYLNPIWKWQQISRVALVASKCDLVWMKDNGEQLSRLKTLAQNMFGNIINTFPQREIFTCAAIKSTEPVENGWYGFPMYDEHGALLARPHKDDQRVRITPSILPCEVPDEWSYGDYSFPEVYARVPAVKVKPPAHKGLDDLFNYLINEDTFE